MRSDVGPGPRAADRGTLSSQRSSWTDDRGEADLAAKHKDCGKVHADGEEVRAELWSVGKTVCEAKRTSSRRTCFRPRRCIGASCMSCATDRRPKTAQKHRRGCERRGRGMTLPVDVSALSHMMMSVRHSKSRSASLRRSEESMDVRAREHHEDSAC